MIIIFIIIVRIMRGPEENHTQWNSIPQSVRVLPKPKFKASLHYSPGGYLF